MNKLYNDTAVQSIANAIRAKNGSSDTYTIAEMSTALNDLSYYAKPTISNVALANFEADGLPLNSLKVAINAVQSGSGEPSPTNIRPISGWDEANVSDVGKNLFDIREFINNSTNKQRCTVSVADDDTVTVTATQTGSVWIGFLANIGGTLPTNTFTIPANVGDEFVPSGTSVILYEVDEDDIILSATNRDVGRYYTVTNSNCKKLAFRLDMGSMQQGESVTFKEQIEKGRTATEYAPYVAPITATISLGQTVYGGELDVVNGTLTVTNGYIASYDGETLPGTWISDRDVYAEGTSPTTGAEICYELAEPIIINLTPTLIKSLNGQNNLSVDCGDVIEIEYFKEV